ncbi:cytochrome P450 [Colletotrichum zoysiae]|uniref:Cytochrome P450 n=1 Tax=Colletotrichum zoysiae TaxID=1216348 RepID=A0AAD9HAQ2_9PEZI|nr:cytochrome P450 [Colletotrichum zoysiae]
MSVILNSWFLAVFCTCIALPYRLVTGSDGVGSVLGLLGLEVVSLALWIGYWIVLYPTYFTPLRNLPTPPKRKYLTGNKDIYFLDNPWTDFPNVVKSIPNNGLIRYYGAFSRELVLVTKPHALREMLGVKAYDFGHSDLVKLAMKRFTGSNLGFLSDEDTKRHRKSLLPAFTTAHIRALVPLFWSKAEEMTACFDSEQAARGADVVLSLGEYGSRATLDGIGLAGMGYNFDTLRDPDNELRRRYRQMIMEPTRAFYWIELLSHHVDFRLLLRLPLKKNLEVVEASNYLRGVARTVIQERKKALLQTKNGGASGNAAGPGDGKDIITVALASGSFHGEQLVDHVMTFLTAGHESTATAFEWTMYELGRNPEIQRRLRSEITAVSFDGPADSAGSPRPSPGIVVQDLPYLNAVLSEVLRHYPFIPLLVRVAQKDTSLVGQPIPKGTPVLYSAMAINHDEQLWGPDAHQFRPDRWLPSSPGNGNNSLQVGTMGNFSMLTFGAGSKSCIGHAFARAELACLVAAVVRRFEIELVNAETAGRIKFGLTNKSSEGMLARLRPVSQ